MVRGRTRGVASVRRRASSRRRAPISMRWQSTWPSKDIFHEYALDFAKKVNDMTGGDLKIEVLPGRRRGARVPACSTRCPRACSTAATACSSITTASRPRSRCGARVPASAWTPTCCCPGTSTAAARSCSTKIFTSIGANVVSFPYGPMPTQPLGWFKKPITKADDFKGLKFRTVGISIDVFTGMGAAVNALPGGEIVAAMDRGLLDAAEFNNASSDRVLGFADVSKVCMLQSYHQNAEQFEIIVQQDEVRRAAGQDEGHHRERRRSGIAGHVLEGDRPVLEGLHRAADQGQRQGSTRRRIRS